MYSKCFTANLCQTAPPANTQHPLTFIQGNWGSGSVLPKEKTTDSDGA